MAFESKAILHGNREMAFGSKAIIIGNQEMPIACKAILTGNDALRELIVRIILFSGFPQLNTDHIRNFPEMVVVIVFVGLRNVTSNL